MLAFSDIFAAFRWWLVLFLMGTAVTPLAFTLFKKLPDKGYAFVKMLGLLIISYIFWVLGSLGFLGNNLGGILVGVLTVIIASAWAYRRDGDEFKAWLQTGWKQILFTEIIFLAAFALWVWVRAQHPAIAATEKPMEFAFLNSASYSPSYPPRDPWLAGFGISYYYFGYVMTSVIARLAFVPEAIAFNLGIAWLFAGTAVGAYGLVYNMIAIYQDEIHPRVQRWAMVLGIVTAMAIPLIGNMQIVLEALHGNNIGSEQFWQWLDIRDINAAPLAEVGPRYEGSNWWWWRSSRVINEYTLAGQQVDPEPIAEFPNFSFILGDMHPHVLALPFAFLSLAVAFMWWLKFSDASKEDILSPATWRETKWENRLKGFLQAIDWPFYLATVLILGGLSFLNTWDVLIHLFVVLGAFFLARWRVAGLNGLSLLQTVLLAVLLAIPAILLYFPFYIGFSSQAGPPFILPMLMRPTRLPQFLVMFGLQLFAITLLLLVLVVRQRFRYWTKGLITAVSLILGLLLLALLLGWFIASSLEGSFRVVNLANELGLSIPARPDTAVALGWGANVVLQLIPAIMRNKLSFPGVTLLLSALLAMIVMIWFELFNNTDSNAETQGRREYEFVENDEDMFASDSLHALVSSSSHLQTSLPFVLLLIGTGALLTLGPEFVYLKDNFGVRLNTVFKFYYQAWMLFGVTAVFSIFYLWHIASKVQQKIVPTIATAGYSFAFVLALMFPFYAVQSRAVEYRGPIDAAERQPATLNGLAQFARYNSEEYAAITWLQNNADANDVVLEAVGGAYSNYARVSANTGIPTVLGWPGHEYQWRGTSTDEPGQRDRIIKDIFNSPDWESTQAKNYLDQYGVTYIYIGNLETGDYSAPGLAKFAKSLDVAYQNGSVTIYRWNPN